MTTGGLNRSPAWGARPSVQEEVARNRLLDAAEGCYAERGPGRTTMTDIAAKAGVHRTTVYSYFPHREAILAACFVRAVAHVVEAGEPHFASDEPFIERLIGASVAGLAVARKSATIRSMISANDFSRTHRATQESETWRQSVMIPLTERFSLAAHAGEVRQDVSPEMMADWVTRICFSLLEEPGHREFGGDAGLLRAFLPAALAPKAG